VWPVQATDRACKSLELFHASLRRLMPPTRTGRNYRDTAVVMFVEINIAIVDLSVSDNDRAEQDWSK